MAIDLVIKGDAVWDRAVSVLAGLGLRVEVDADFARLAAFNAAAPKWFPLIAPYNPALAPVEPGAAIAIFLLDAAGAVRGCIAARRRELPCGGLAAALADGSLIFGDVVPAGCGLDLDIDDVSDVGGVAALPGCTYLHPDYRHTGADDCLSGLIVGAMQYLWQPDWVLAMVEPRRLIPLGFDVYRMRRTLGYITIHEPRLGYGDAGRRLVMLACSHVDARRRYPTFARARGGEVVDA